ncbi:MAG: hypothetical protein KDM63_09755 [Verrucomicrobiae bacterium]|nr:hypothetical protein [Verrucomicrobiae bacterium]
MENQKGLPPNGSSQSNREIRSVTMRGLALVDFQVRTQDSTDDVEDLLTYFYDLGKIEGLPEPFDLLKMLIEDNVFEDCGVLLGEVPMRQFVEEGLFLCYEMTTETNYGPSPFVGLKVTPKGIAWLMENYGPEAERHFIGMVPE